MLAAVLLNIAFLPINLVPMYASAVASQSADVWWPTNGAHVTGTQPFKAMVQGLDVNSYDMYWQVDGGGLVPMYNSYQDYQHKEAQVDLSGWTWHGSGPYDITFVAKKGGVVVAQSDANIYVDNGLPTYSPQPAAPAPAPTQTQVQAPAQPQSQTSQVQPVTSVSAPAPQPAPVQVPVQSGFYVDPNSNAATQAAAWQSSRPSDAAKMSVLAAQPTAKWFGGWSGDIQSAVHDYVSTAASAGKIPMLVAYNIPQRDCGGYSAGGASDYTSWIGGFARGIGNSKAIVILEPDALAQMSCLSSSDQQHRYDLISGAVSVLKSNPNTSVYIDAGHSGWVDVGTMAAQLQKANVGSADGFSLNVSNFETTANESVYGAQISSQIGNKHFVIDTSRNGSGSNGQWCNPWGATIGNKPTTQTGNNLVDAFLWIKTPGESDGTCNGGPSAGTWWPDYALNLVK